MFTGIVKSLCRVTHTQKMLGILKYAVELPSDLSMGLEIGASVAVDGVCQTVVRIEDKNVWFDAIQETLDRSTLDSLEVGRFVNIERSACFGDEVGGHILSGHIYGRGRIAKIERFDANTRMEFQCPQEWMKYFFSKGYIAIDGASLTLVDVDPKGSFSVHLIPETLRVTTLGRKQEGDFVNLELDSQTQVIVETIERILKERSHLN